MLLTRIVKPISFESIMTINGILCDAFEQTCREVRMQLDSGADVTVISIGTWSKIGSPGLSQTSMITGAANGS